MIDVLATPTFFKNTIAHMHGQTWPKLLKKIIINKLELRLAWFSTRDTYATPKKGAVIIFIFSYVNPYLLSLCPVIMKTADSQPCFGMDARGCLIPSLDITESPNPFRNLWFTCQIIGPFSKQNIKIFPYLYRDPKIRIKLGGDSEKSILGLFFFKN